MAAPPTPEPLRERAARWGASLALLAAILGAGAAAGRAPWTSGALPGLAEMPVDGAHGFFLFHAVAERLRGAASWARLDELWFPVGRPLGLAIQNAVDAVLAAPLLWVFGPTRGFALVSAALMASNAVAGAWLGRVLRGGRLAELAGAVALGFCPYAWDELNFGRTTQAWLAPMALALGLAWRAGERPDGRRIVAAGAGLALAGYAYWFYGVFVALLVAAVLVGQLGPRAGLRPLGGVAAAALVLTAPFVLLVALGWGEVPGTAMKAGRFAVGAEYLAGLPGRPRMAAEYVPHALWLLAGYAALARPRRLTTLLALATIGWAIFALGRTVDVGGTRFSLPYAWLADLPGFRRFWWPNRALGAVTVGLVPLVCLAVGALGPRGRLLAAAGLLLTVAQCLWAPGPAAVWRVPAVGRWHAALPPGAVLVLPMLDPTAGMRAVAQQPLHGRPLVNGMSMWERYLWPDAWGAWSDGQPLVAALLAAERGEPASVPAGAVQRLAEVGVVGIVVEPAGLARARAQLEPALGAPVCPADGSACWWALPAPGAAAAR